VKKENTLKKKKSLERKTQGGKDGKSVQTGIIRLWGDRGGRMGKRGAEIKELKAKKRKTQKI